MQKFHRFLPKQTSVAIAIVIQIKLKKTVAYTKTFPKLSSQFKRYFHFNKSFAFLYPLHLR